LVYTDDTTRRIRYISRVCLPMLEAVCEAGRSHVVARQLASVSTLRQALLDALTERES
jgi:hypothetical protein